MHKKVRNTILNNVLRVWSGLQVYNYQDDLAIWYKETKNNKLAINKITLKKSLMYNKDEKNFINASLPSRRCSTTCLVYKAKCNITSAKIQKANVM